MLCSLCNLLNSGENILLVPTELAVYEGDRKQKLWCSRTRVVTEQSLSGCTQ